MLALLTILLVCAVMLGYSIIEKRINLRPCPECGFNISVDALPEQCPRCGSLVEQD